jgi:hypothetical protein
MSIRIIPVAISFALAFAVVQASSPAQAQVKLRYAHVGVTSSWSTPAACGSSAASIRAPGI